MIYLTLDTNIWLDLLEDSWGEENIIDKLEYWLKHDFVKILVPEIIIEEWERNKKGVKYDKLNNDFDTFLKISQDVLPESFIYELRDKNYQAVIFETQIQRIETIICNAVKLRLSDTVRDQIILQGVQRKAPMQKKSSIGDAIIIYTLFDFAQKQQQDYFYFISRDASDFCKDGQIHEDLRDKFDALNIVHFIKLKKCISDIERKFGFRDDPNAEERRKSRLKNRLKKVVYNPEYEKLVAGAEDSFILNCKMLDFIVEITNPTKEQVFFVLALIDSNTSYERYFFERVSSIVWFGILKQKGVFESHNCPSIVKVDNVVKAPVWYPLQYVVKLCEKHLHKIDEKIGNDILEIIEKVTKSEVDNYNVWYDFLQILVKLPNERITTSVLEHVGRWFLDEHSKHYSYVLIEELIPKFLSDNPNAQDVEKAKILLKLIFRIEERRDSHITNYWGKEDSYRLLVDIEHTKDFLYKKNYFVNIVKYCPEIIFDATESLNKLHLDFGDGLKINLESDTSVVTLTVKSNGTDFWLFISENKPFDKEKIEQESTQLVRTSDTVPLHNSESEIEQYVLRYLHENNIAIIDHDKNKEEIRYLCENLKNGKEYIGLFSGSLDEYIEGSLNSNRPVEILSFIFIEILKEMIQSKADFTVSVLKSFISESKYSLTFYKKVAIYIIEQNWESGKELFWSFADLETFTTPTYKRDILNLLQKHQNKFTESEIGVLSDIISSMSSYLPPYWQNLDIRYYQRAYYYSLKSITTFRTAYENLSKSLNMPHDDENITPVNEPYVKIIIKKEELLRKEIQDIVGLISTLPNDNSSDQRAVYNFSQTFSAAVSQEPNKFIDEIDRFNEAPYLFVYQVARGLENAWKNKMPFNWEKAIDFFTKYTLNEDFGTDKFIIPLYKWNIDGQNVLGAVADLLREGMRDDANAFEISLLPKVKNLLISSFVKAEAVDLEIQDSLSYSLNSTFGKILISIVEYSLRRARKMSNENAFEKWEDEIKGLFDRALEKEIIDAYNVVGMYFPQLCYLDKEWTFGKIQDFFDKDEKLWFGFFINFVFYNKYRSKEIYNLFYKHYQRAIKSNFEQKRLYSKGIIPQLLIFYFASIENLYEEGLFPLFLNNIKSSELIDLVRYITYNYESILDVTDGNTEMTQSKIYDLWKMIPDKTHILSDKDKNEVMVKLIEWLQYVELLNEDFTFLILKSVPHIDTYYNISHLVENLTRLMDNGGKYDNSQYISRILKLLTFKYYISNTNKAHLVTLVNFIYQWGEKIDADEICNIVAKNGHDFLHDTYLNNRERE